MRPARQTAAGACLIVLSIGGAHAEPVTYCVSCTGPDRSYACRVDTSKASPGVDALQYYCIVRTAKDGGHKSCSATRQGDFACKGRVKTYTYTGPDLSPRAQRAARRFLGPRANAAGDSPASSTEKGEPKTLLELGSRAVKASRKGLRGTGQAVRDAAGRTGDALGKATKGAGKRVGGAAGTTGEAIGNASKSVGKRVSGAARSASTAVGKATKNVSKRFGGAARSASSTVGGAARTAYDCVKSLFKDCRTSRADQDSQEPPERETAAPPVGTR